MMKNSNFIRPFYYPLNTNEIIIYILEQFGSFKILFGEKKILMSFFDIHTKLNDLFEWDQLPFRRNGNLLLPNSNAISLHSGWGDMFFHFWNRHKYILYLNFYDIRHHRVTQVRSGETTVEFTLMLVNNIVNTLGGFSASKILTSFFNIFYLNEVDSLSEFMQGQYYCTLDIHLKEVFILELLQDFPEIMEPFVNNIERKRSVFLLPSYMPATLFMNELAISIFHSLKSGINLNIVDKDVEAMIAHALTYMLSPNNTHLNKERWQLMNEIYFKLVENPFKMPGIKELCRIAGMNATTLRRIFKETFRMTIHQCWIKLKLDSALNMIRRDRNKLLEDISEEVGFSCLANFSKAFKREYNYPPSVLKSNLDFFNFSDNRNF